MNPTPPPSPKPVGFSSPESRIGQVLAGSIELTDILGVGAYGTVYKARDLQTHVQYAVKVLSKLGLDARQKKFQDREIRLHFAASQHPNVVSLVKILDSTECIYVVLEYCPEGDLFSKITEEGHYVNDDFKAKQVFLQILSAVQHCHAKGIYHRDLKPENVLVKDNGWTVKLADFGLATQDRITSDFGCGSTFYMSPECQQPNPKPFACYASAANDVWSLGVILVNLTCGRNPWKRASMDDSTFRAFMRDRNFLQTILPISDELNQILQRIFEVNPQRRVTLEELREMILQCSRLTPAPTTTEITAPMSPPRSPVDASPVAGVNSLYDSVPQLDLPAQQYPSAGPNLFDPAGPILSTSTIPGPCNPDPTLYTYAPKPAAPNGYPYLGNFPDFRRCGNMFANLNVPHHFWAPTH